MMRCLVAALALMALCFADAAVKKQLFGQQPNIIFLLVDDMGWNDIGFHNDYMKTPVLDNLANTGVILDNNYVHPICTASRASMMTGLYAFRSGPMLIFDNRPQCIPLDMKLLPERMKEEGYATALVGKWHLGMCHKDCTPTYRGFDSFYGYLNGYVDYYTHKVDGGYDLRDNEDPVTDKDGVYTTTLINDKAMEVLDNHDTSTPLFMYLAHEAPHSPIQAPDEFVQKCDVICDTTECQERRTFCGMMAALDDAVGKFVNKLKEKGMYDNTYIIFSSDNGGAVDHTGNNWPYRGSKATVWEGGTKAVAFIHSPLLWDTNYIHHGLSHGVDMFSTMVSLAGGYPDKYYPVDGVDQTFQWAYGFPFSAREEFIYNIDPTIKFPITVGKSAIRVGDYKLIVGNPGFAHKHTWFPAPEFTGDTTRPDVDQNNLPHYHLFDLSVDPYEEDNLADQMPYMVDYMEYRLMDYLNQVQNYTMPPPNPNSNPNNYGGFWTPGWCELSEING